MASIAVFAATVGVASQASALTLGWPLPITMSGEVESSPAVDTGVGWQAGVDSSSSVSFKAPVKGHLTTARVQAGTIVAPGYFKFVVIRPAQSASQFTVVAASSKFLVDDANAVNTFSGMSMPMQKDDQLAAILYAGYQMDISGIEGGPGDLIYLALGDPAVGQLVTFAPLFDPTGRLAMNYDLVPDPRGPRPLFTKPADGKHFKPGGARRLMFKGTTNSDTEEVELALVRLVKAQSEKKSKTACQRYNPARGAISKQGIPCKPKKFTYFGADLNGKSWSKKLGASLGPGSYRAYVRATDDLGNITAADKYGMVSFEVV